MSKSDQTQALEMGHKHVLEGARLGHESVYDNFLNLSRRVDTLEASARHKSLDELAAIGQEMEKPKPTITRAEALAIAEAVHYSCSATIQRMNAIEQFASRMGIQITDTPPA
jgi:hypothetical protein